jgi:hypothetical protein
MQVTRLRRLIETGNYKPEPARVAEAMLGRRAVRELLTDGCASRDRDAALNPAGRTRSGPEARRQAA